MPLHEWEEVVFSGVAADERGETWLDTYGGDFHLFGARRYRRGKGEQHMSVLLKSEARACLLVAQLRVDRPTLVVTERRRHNLDTGIYDFIQNADYLDHVYAYASDVRTAEWLVEHAPNWVRAQPSWDAPRREEWKRSFGRPGSFKVYFLDDLKYPPHPPPNSSNQPPLAQRKRTLNVVEFEDTWFGEHVHEMPRALRTLPMLRLEMMMRSHVSKRNGQGRRFQVNLSRSDSPYMPCVRALARWVRSYQEVQPGFTEATTENVMETFGFSDTQRWKICLELALDEPRWFDGLE